MFFLNVGLSRRNGKLELRGGILEAVRHSSTARLSGGHSRHENNTGETYYSKKTFLATTTKRLDLNIYIVGAGA